MDMKYTYVYASKVVHVPCLPGTRYRLIRHETSHTHRAYTQPSTLAKYQQLKKCIFHFLGFFLPIISLSLLIPQYRPSSEMT